jgi:transcriptional regulator with XRE-family HTH domain
MSGTDLPDLIDTSLPVDQIGVHVARFRRRSKLKVADLARRVGVSGSLISQIEHGQSRPSVATLFALAEALEVPVDEFFGRSSPNDGSGATSEGTTHAVRPQPDDGMPPQDRTGSDRFLVRRSERPTIEIEGGVHWERLTPNRLEFCEFLELVYAPRAESNPVLYRHPGIELVLVLSGRFDITIGFERYRLRAGDSIWFPSTSPHRYVNPTDEEARAVTVILSDVGPSLESG